MAWSSITEGRIFFQAWGLQTNFIPRGENLSITSQNRLRIETGTNRLLFFSINRTRDQKLMKHEKDLV